MSAEDICRSDYVASHLARILIPLSESQIMQVNFVSPWSRFLENLIVPYLVKKCPAFYGPGMYISVFTSACLWSLP